MTYEKTLKSGCLLVLAAAFAAILSHPGKAFAQIETSKSTSTEAGEIGEPMGAIVTESSVTYMAPPTDFRFVENRPFKPGEFLRFTIKYEFVPAGEATMEVSEGEPVDGRKTIRFLSKAESNNFIDVFFKVRDFNSSLVDRRSLASLAFHQNLREGHYRIIRNTTKNYQTNTWRYERIYKGKTTIKTGSIEKPASDILSAFYYTRTLPLEVGKSYELPVFSDPDVYSLRVDVADKLYTVKVPAGEFECFRVQPHVVGDALFKAKGEMWIYLTADDRRMPVLIRSKAIIGSFDAELAEFVIPS